MAASIKSAEKKEDGIHYNGKVYTEAEWDGWLKEADEIGYLLTICDPDSSYNLETKEWTPSAAQIEAAIKGRKAYRIFNDTRTVYIGKDYVELYEKNVAPFNEKRAEYLAVSGGADEYSDEAALSIVIENGIREEVNVYRNKESIIAMAATQGIIIQ